MQSYLRSLALCLLVGSGLVGGSCASKKDDPKVAPGPTTAALSGQVSPTGAITTVTATDAGGKTTTATPGSTGAYSIPNLPLGPYTLAYAPAAGYLAPALSSATLVAGGTVVPTVAVAPAPTTATLSGQVNPVSSVVTVTATNASGVAVTVTPNATGAYFFPNLAFGAYALTFAPATGYAAPASTSVVLVSGGTTAAAVTLTLATPSASFSVNGAAVRVGYFFSLIVAGQRFVRFSVQPGGAPGPTVDLTVGGVTPVAGTYELNSYDYNASYLSADYFSYYSDQFALGRPNSGTVTITVNPALRRYSGAFRFTGRDVSSGSPSGYIPPGTPPTVDITGSFDNFVY